MTPDERNQAEIWNEYASKGPLQSTIDPRDAKGLKCRYIDRWSRHYIRKYLALAPDMSLLEIGCGSGRNLFPLSKRIRHGYGVDIASAQITNAVAWRNRLDLANIDFSHDPEAFLSAPPSIDAVLTMWVLAGFQDDALMITVLRGYVDSLPTCHRFVLFEQVATSRYEVREGDRFYKTVRTKAEYIELLGAAGLVVEKHETLPEKGFGPLYRRFFMGRLYYWMPSWLDLSANLFPLDRLLVDRSIRDTFTDGVFVCGRG